MQLPKKVETTEITIQQLLFTVPKPFAEGHTLTANEANVLNQTLHENLRNNYASAVKKAKEEANGADPDMAELQTGLDAYIKEYEFGVRRSGGGGVSIDPIDRKALALAKDQVKRAIKAKGLKVTEVGNERITELAEGLLEKNPSIREQAKTIIELERQAATDEVADAAAKLVA